MPKWETMPEKKTICESQVIMLYFDERVNVSQEMKKGKYCTVALIIRVFGLSSYTRAPYV